jgi:hypothetical protein
MALRSQISIARDLIDALPGGEMLLEHQQEVIAMLSEMRDKRRSVLAALMDGCFFNLVTVRAQLACLSELSLGNSA